MIFPFIVVKINTFMLMSCLSSSSRLFSFVVLVDNKRIIYFIILFKSRGQFCWANEVEKPQEKEGGGNTVDSHYFSYYFYVEKTYFLILNC